MLRSSKGAQRSELVKSIMRKRHRTPIILYQLKDIIVEITSNRNFMDAVLILVAFAAMCAALQFYPLALIPLLMLLLFVAAIYHPFLGLVTLMIVTFPAAIYQVPALAWIFTLVISVSLMLGYMHNRTIVFGYLMVALAFSNAGYLLAVPVLAFAVLVVGYKRAMLMTALFVLAVVMLSGVMGMQNSAYVLYNATRAHALIGNGITAQYYTPDKAALTLGDFGQGFGNALHTFGAGDVMGSVSTSFSAMVTALFVDPTRYLLELAGLEVVVFLIDGLAIRSRSRYKGTKASIAIAGYPLAYFGMATLMGITPASYSALFGSFVLAPATLAFLETYNVNIVKALDVRKQDIRMKFGEAFEDLDSSSSSEKFENIGNYESTKKELHEAVILPIEEKGISRAYNVKPTKGILFFGPPGTGKTMMMRALANDIRAGFYLVKAPNLISAYPGESERLITKIFNIAKKNSPSVLFIDEIDSIARSRENPDVDETHRLALSQLLVEMDGFKENNRVIVVGATNVPNVLDPAIMRPGRFDKLIYMPLPDLNGRKKIFDIYLNRLPLSKDADVSELAAKTERYSGADIKAVCENVAKVVAQEALSKHRVLEITQQDILEEIKSTKPSTTLSQLDAYNNFRIDFERRSFKEEKIENGGQPSIESIVGLEDAKKAIIDAVQIPILHPELIKKYDIKPINGLLMFGPPGTGKTMLMKAVSNEMKEITMLELRGTEIANDNVERAVAAIKETFNRARENLPAIVFIDEIDGIVPKRSGASEGSIQITSAVLEEMDGIKRASGIVVIAATNRPDAIDPAILRPGRFDKLIFVKPPNADEREELFRQYLENVPMESNADFSKLRNATRGFTGADIANICREAKTRALESNLKTGKEAEISIADIETLARKVRPSAPETVVSSYLSFLARYGQR